MANGLPYYKAYPRDFIEGTIGMPFEIKCGYRVILDLIYMQGGKLPDDARYISGLLGCSLRKWSALRGALILADKIQVSGGFVSNYRADKELETLAKLQDIQRQNASGPRKNKDLQEPPPNQPEPEPDIEEREANASLSSGDDFALNSPAPVDDISEAVSAYNSAATESGWPSIKVLSKARRAALAARLKECGGIDGWRAALQKAQSSGHCCGNNERGWVASFDFLTRQSSFTKLMEGNYDDRKQITGVSGSNAFDEIAFAARLR